MGARISSRLEIVEENESCETRSKQYRKVF